MVSQIGTPFQLREEEGFLVRSLESRRFLIKKR